METGLKGKVAAITGGGTGIGEAVAKAFLEEGCRVAVCGRRPDILEEAAHRLDGGDRLLTVVADVSSPDDMQRFASVAAERFGGLDVWVNNAGISAAATLADCSQELWDRLIGVNLTGAWNATRAAIPYLKRNGGCVVNVSSYSSLVPQAGIGVYAVTKSALNALTKVFAAELCPYGIRVNAVAPGMTETPLAERQEREMRAAGAAETEIAAKNAERLRAIAMRRLAKPEEIAWTVVFLASGLSDYITGETVFVSGGKGIVQNPMDPWNRINKCSY